MDTTPTGVQSPVAQTSVSKTLIVPGSIPEAYRAEAIRPDGTTHIFPSCRAVDITFGLNYDLFALPWKVCLIAHDADSWRRVFFATRQEWERGELQTVNREPQMFLAIPTERHFDLDLYRMQANDGIKAWVDDVVANMDWKGA